MNAHLPRSRILIIDRQDYWRNSSSQRLSEAGYAVSSLAGYDLWQPEQNGQPKPDLVILGCSSIGKDEQRLITRLLSDRQNLVVLCTSLPPQVMRSLFVAGVSDVADKPYEPAHVVEVVTQAIKILTQRNSYRMVMEEGI